ncbi:hypothetical protein FRC12_018054 [Ceratobasidium sp. 428]|nr:hypothetical protein FRC12_018054 [Ceratobasidium sp. 428]
MDYLKPSKLLRGLSRRRSRSPIPKPSSADPDGPRSPSITSEENAKHADWTGLKAFADALSKVGDVFGPLKSAIDVFMKFVEASEVFLSLFPPTLSVAQLKTMKSVVETQEEYPTLRTAIDWLFHDLDGRFRETIPVGMQSSIFNIARGIEQEITLLQPKGQRHGLGQYTVALQNADRVLKCYRRIQTLLELLVLNANVNVWMLVDEQATRYRLDNLVPSHAAWYSSAESQKLHRDECTPDTRVQVLEQFKVWRDDDEGERIYWLNGMAGTGKTTLSYTLCKQLEEDSRLAANFFCSRQLPTCRDARLILPTIAYQLANFSYPFRYALSRVLEQSPDVHTRRISEQFTKLLFKPLQEVRRSIPDNLVIVLEALDECDSPGEILDALLDYTSDLPIRFFLTSRPEPEIRERMYLRTGDRENSELHLHNLDKSIVEGDIRRYLQDGLKRIDISEEDLKTLTDRSGVLFIYAATVVRYVSASNFSRSADRLEQVLSASASSYDSDKEINSLYTLILTSAFDDPDMTDRDKDEMKLVLHTAICAQEPLSAQITAGLLGLKRAESVHAALSPLRSVLNIQTAGEGITTLHKSFPDYMLSEARSQRFYCDAEQIHSMLAKRCLDVIKTSDPPFNICGLEPSFTLDEHVQDLDQRIEQHISGELFYACRYWGAHSELAVRSQALQDDVHAFLSTRLLLWMEVMNLKRCLQDVGVKMISRVRDHVEHREYPTGDRGLAWDACDFVDAYLASPASRSTPHIYISALSFWAPERPVSVYYSRLFQNPLAQPHASIPLAIYSIGSSVRCVAYSPDGRSISAGSDDATIQIWNSHTGQKAGAPLEGHDGPISSIAYSPDGKHIASSSTDGSIRIWDVNSRWVEKILHDEVARTIYSAGYDPLSPPLLHSGSADGKNRYWDPDSATLHGEARKGRVGPIYSAAQSPNGKRLTSGSSDGTTLTWDTESGEVTTAECIGRTPAVYSLAYSPDSTRIISGSGDKTVRIWDVETGLQAIGSPLEGHAAAVTSVIYSPSGRRIISGSMDGTILVWDSFTGQKLFGPSTKPGEATTAESISHGRTTVVYSLACSPDKTEIISGSEDKTFRIRIAETGQTIGSPLEGHTAAITSVIYSPSGRRIISGSMDGTIRVWDSYSGETVVGPLIGHGGPVYCVACSPDGTTIASGSADGTIRLWSIETGGTVREPLKWHSLASHSVVYSSSTTPNALSLPNDVTCFWGTEGGRLQLSPPRQKMISEVLSDPRLVSSAQDYSESNQANLFRIQDCYTTQTSSDRLTESTRKDSAISSPQLSSLLETGPELCHRWSFDGEGWIVINSTHRLAWVPSHIRDQIWHPRAAGAIYQSNVIRVDLGTVMAGGMWRQCYAPLKTWEWSDLINSEGSEQEAPADPGHLIIPASLQGQNNATSNDDVTYPNMQTTSLAFLAAVPVLLSIFCAYMWL